MPPVAFPFLQIPPLPHIRHTHTHTHLRAPTHLHLYRDPHLRSALKITLFPRPSLTPVQPLVKLLRADCGQLSFAVEAWWEGEVISPFSNVPFSTSSRSHVVLLLGIITIEPNLSARGSLGAAYKPRQPGALASVSSAELRVTRTKPQPLNPCLTWTKNTELRRQRE